MSKTKIGLKTALSVLSFALIQGVLSFYRVSVLISAYGDRINGVVQVALQISAYLVLFQSGMSAAYQFRMYSPLANGEYGRIASLFSGLFRSMLRVSGKMLLVSLVVIPAYSALLLNKGVGYLDTVLILFAVGIRITVLYFYTLPERCLIEIKEKKYIVTAIEGAKDCASLLAEILLVLYTPIPLPVILCANFVFLAAAKLAYRILIRRLYGSSLSVKSEPEYAPADMTKAVYAHQASTIATSNTDNVGLSILSSLKNVTIYSSYAILISYPAVVISRMIEGMRATLALKITRGDEDSFTAFRQLLSFSFFCVCAVVPVFLHMANPFVELWIGKQYCIGWLPLVLFALILADGFVMPVIYAARDSKGLYRESRNFTIVQALVNVVLSVALVIPFGVTGVLAGTFAALYLILQPCNFRLVYSAVFKRRLSVYFDLLISAVICAFSYTAAALLFAFVFPAGVNSWEIFIGKTALCSAIALAAAFAGLWAVNRGFRDLLSRFKRKQRQAEALS